MTIALGSDHAGFALRQAIRTHLIAQGHVVNEYGATSEDRFDYPVASNLVADQILKQKAEFGILVCGTGIGVSIRANRFRGIRAALCTSNEMALLAREHNYANVLCLGARILEQGHALEIVDSFLSGGEDHAERHENRVDLLDAELGC